MKIKVYFDNAATTPLDKRVLVAMLPYLKKKYGNASTIYLLGQEAKEAIEKSREIIANFISAKKEEIIFTSGGTESNNLAIKGVALANEKFGQHIITSQIEHHAVLEPCHWLEKRGFKITYLPVDRNGLVNLNEVEKAITNETILISIMQANNEIGTIQPIAEIGKIVKKIRARRYEIGIKIPIYFHTDAVQSFGHLPINVDELGVDLLSASAHKLYGPKGIGLLYLRRGVKIEPLLHGGGHEQGIRSGTENVAGIVGFAKAVELARETMNEEYQKLIQLKEKMIKGIFEKIKDVRLNGHPHLRLPNNLNFSIEGVEGEAMVLALNEVGIAASTGSACSSKSLRPSHVLKAIGLSDAEAHSSLRLTLGRFTKEREINYFLKIFPQIIKKLRSISPFYKKINQ
ncbi:MAG: cysteine desulfurase NifS [Patescibacteria group bacterium]|nr:cysteine desulfurase NifS [Patescibacteria group bacterium]